MVLSWFPVGNAVVFLNFLDLDCLTRFSHSFTADLKLDAASAPGTAPEAAPDEPDGGPGVPLSAVFAPDQNPHLPFLRAEIGKRVMKYVSCGGCVGDSKSSQAVEGQTPQTTKNCKVEQRMRFQRLVGVNASDLGPVLSESMPGAGRPHFYTHSGTLAPVRHGPAAIMKEGLKRYAIGWNPRVSVEEVLDEGGEMGGAGVESAAGGMGGSESGDSDWQAKARKKTSYAASGNRRSGHRRHRNPESLTEKSLPSETVETNSCSVNTVLNRVLRFNRERDFGVRIHEIGAQLRRLTAEGMNSNGRLTYDFGIWINLGMKKHQTKINLMTKPEEGVWGTNSGLVNSESSTSGSKTKSHQHRIQKLPPVPYLIDRFLSSTGVSTYLGVGGATWDERRPRVKRFEVRHLSGLPQEWLLQMDGKTAKQFQNEIGSELSKPEDRDVLTCGKHEELFSRVLVQWFGLDDVTNKRITPDRPMTPSQLGTDTLIQRLRRLSFPPCKSRPEPIFLNLAPTRKLFMRPDVGLRAELYVHDSQECSIGHGYYEITLLTDFIGIMRRLGMVADNLFFLDIGANVGVWSLAAAGAGMPVISVEPLPYNIELLQISMAEFARENNVRRHSRVLQVAVTDNPGEAGTGGVSEERLPSFKCIVPTHYNVYNFDRQGSTVESTFTVSWRVRDVMRLNRIEHARRQLSHFQSNGNGEVEELKECLVPWRWGEPIREIRGWNRIVVPMISMDEAILERNLLEDVVEGLDKEAGEAKEEAEKAAAESAKEEAEKAAAESRASAAGSAADPDDLDSPPPKQKAPCFGVVKLDVEGHEVEAIRGSLKSVFGQGPANETNSQRSHCPGPPCLLYVENHAGPIVHRYDYSLGEAPQDSIWYDGTFGSDAEARQVIHDLGERENQLAQAEKAKRDRAEESANPNESPGASQTQVPPAAAAIKRSRIYNRTYDTLGYRMGRKYNLALFKVLHEELGYECAHKSAIFIQEITDQRFQPNLGDSVENRTVSEEAARENPINSESGSRLPATRHFEPETQGTREGPVHYLSRNYLRTSNPESLTGMWRCFQAHPRCIPNPEFRAYFMNKVMARE